MLLYWINNWILYKSWLTFGMPVRHLFLIPQTPDLTTTRYKLPLLQSNALIYNADTNLTSSSTIYL